MSALSEHSACHPNTVLLLLLESPAALLVVQSSENVKYGLLS